MRRGRRAEGWRSRVGGGGRCSRPARSWASSRARARGARTRPARHPKQPAPGCCRPQSPPLWRRSTCRYHAHERRTLSIPREWCTQQSARAPPLIRVWCLSRVLRYYYYHFLESKKESAPRRGRPRAARLSLEFRARQRAASRARHFSTNYLCLIGYAHTLLYLKTIIVRFPTRRGSVRVKDLLDTAAAHKGGAGAGGWEHREHISGYAGRALTRRPRRSSSLQSLSRRFLGLQEQRLGQRWRGRRRGQEQTEQAS